MEVNDIEDFVRRILDNMYIGYEKVYSTLTFCMDVKEGRMSEFYDILSTIGERPKTTIISDGVNFNLELETIGVAPILLVRVKFNSDKFLCISIMRRIDKGD